MRNRHLTALGLLCLSTAAVAHPGHAGSDGLFHYLLSPEHTAGLGLLAVLMVGALALRVAVRGRRRR